MDAQFDTLDRVPRDAWVVAKRQASVNDGMGDDVARVRLVSILRQFPRLAQSACDLIEVAPLREHAREAPVALETLFSTRKPARGQQSCREAVARRVSHVP